MKTEIMKLCHNPKQSYSIKDCKIIAKSYVYYHLNPNVILNCTHSLFQNEDIYCVIFEKNNDLCSVEVAINNEGVIQTSIGELYETQY